MRTRDSIHRKRSPFFGPERFTYEPEHNRYLCPAGQPLNYGGRAIGIAPSPTSGPANVVVRARSKPQCTSAPFRCLVIHQHEPARQRARELVNTPEFAKAQRQRKKVEALFAELKNQIGLRRLRLRRLKFVREQFFLAAVAQNIKRLVRFLSQADTTPFCRPPRKLEGVRKHSEAAVLAAEQTVSLSGLFQHPRLFTSTSNHLAAVLAVLTCVLSHRHTVYLPRPR